MQTVSFKDERRFTKDDLRLPIKILDQRRAYAGLDVQTTRDEISQQIVNGAIEIVVLIMAPIE